MTINPGDVIEYRSPGGRRVGTVDMLTERSVVLYCGSWVHRLNVLRVVRQARPEMPSPDAISRAMLRGEVAR